jgi:hypothetical protein
MATMKAVSGKMYPVIVGAGAFFGPLIVGVVLWLVGKLVSAGENIGAACMIATYAFFPRILGALVQVIMAFVIDPSKLNGMNRVTLSAAYFLDPNVASPVSVVLASRIDVFVIWSTILLAIGLSVVARIPRSKAAIAAAIVFVLGTIVPVFGAIRAS